MNFGILLPPIHSLFCYLRYILFWAMYACHVLGVVFFYDKNNDKALVLVLTKKKYTLHLVMCTVFRHVRSAYLIDGSPYHTWLLCALSKILWPWLCFSFISPCRFYARPSSFQISHINGIRASMSVTCVPPLRMSIMNLLVYNLYVHHTGNDAVRFGLESTMALNTAAL